MTLETWQWAWLAGIFEGEGFIGFTNDTRKYRGTSVQLRVCMTDEDVIRTLNELAPAPSIRTRIQDDRKKQWVWQLSGKREVERFLTGVLPYLHARRRARATAALERLSKNLGAHADRTHCKHGHEFTAENTRIRSNGSRACITCQIRRDAERKVAGKIERAEQRVLRENAARERRRLIAMDPRPRRVVAAEMKVSSATITAAKKEFGQSSVRP